MRGRFSQLCAFFCNRFRVKVEIVIKGLNVLRVAVRGYARYVCTRNERQTIRRDKVVIVATI